MSALKYARQLETKIITLSDGAFVLCRCYKMTITYTEESKWTYVCAGDVIKRTEFMGEIHALGMNWEQGECSLARASPVTTRCVFTFTYRNLALLNLNFLLNARSLHEVFLTSFLGTPL